MSGDAARMITVHAGQRRNMHGESCRCEADLQLADAGGDLLPEHQVDTCRQRAISLAAKDAPAQASHKYL